MEENYKKKIEALLFTSGKPLEIEKISEMLGLGSIGMVKTLLQELKQEYNTKDSAIEILEENNRYRMNIKPDFIPIVKDLMSETELDRPTISTLAIIAWKQPILQSKVVKMRGNTAYDHLKLLEELGFVLRKPQGLTRLITLTPKFFEYFDTNKDSLISTLPKESVPEAPSESL